MVKWAVEIGDEFEPEFDELPEDVQDESLAHAWLLEECGPRLGRPWVDTLHGSSHANMKELRFNASGGVWPSRSTPADGQSCLSLVINRASVKNGSTVS